MNLEARILELLKEGKSVDAIELIIVKEFADLEVEAISKAIEAGQKAFSLQANRKSVEAQKAEDVKVSKRIDELFEAKMKSIEVDPAKKFMVGSASTKSRESIVDRNKTVEMNSSQAEAYGLYEKQLRAIIHKDSASAKSISKEIDDYNAKAAGDPVRSDSDAVGGYAIPTEVDSEIRILERTQSVILANAMSDVIIVNDKIYPVAYSVACVDIADQATNVTEDLLAMDGPTVDMKRFGAFMNVSNTIIRQRGDIATTVSRMFASARAKFLDYRLSVGNVTGASQLVDGIVFDPNTNAPTAIALTAMTIQTLENIKNTLSAEANGKIMFMGNRKIQGAIGLLKDTAGNYIFQNYISGGSPLAPLGIPFLLNTEMTSVLDVGGDNNTGGTDDVLVCADFSKFVVGVAGGARIEATDAYDFVGDNTTMKIVGSYGAKVLSSTSTAGIVAVAQELTN